MFFTESTSLLTRTVQIVLPLGFYAFMFTLKKKPGKMFWWLFWFMFVGAFQIVLLWLYGESPIAVDMFLNVLTTNPGEATELLSNLLVAVIFVLVLYGFGIALSIVSWRSKTTLSDGFQRRQRIWSLPVLALGAIYRNSHLRRNSVSLSLARHLVPTTGAFTATAETPTLAQVPLMAWWCIVTPSQCQTLPTRVYLCSCRVPEVSSMIASIIARAL